MILPLAWKNASPAAIFTRTRVPMGKWIHHVQIATVQAELAHPRGDPYVCFLFDQLGACDERVPWRTAFLLICDGRLRFETSYHNGTTTCLGTSRYFTSLCPLRPNHESHNDGTIS